LPVLTAGFGRHLLTQLWLLPLEFTPALEQSMSYWLPGLLSTHIHHTDNSGGWGLEFGSLGQLESGCGWQTASSINSCSILLFLLCGLAETSIANSLGCLPIREKSHIFFRSLRRNWSRLITATVTCQHDSTVQARLSGERLWLNIESTNILQLIRKLYLFVVVLK
jgi:hypothetical protein